MATENTMAAEIDPDKSLVDNETVNDGLSDSVADNVNTDTVDTVEQPVEESQSPEANETPSDTKPVKPELELKGKIDLSFNSLVTQHKTLGPTLEYNKILEKIVKEYKDWQATNYGTYAKKIGEHTVEYDGYSLPKVDGELISTYLTSPSTDLEEILKKI